MPSNQNLGIAGNMLGQEIEAPDFLHDDSAGGTPIHAGFRSVGRCARITSMWRRPGIGRSEERAARGRMRRHALGRQKRLLWTNRAHQSGRLITEMELDAVTVRTSDSTDAKADAVRQAGGRTAKMNALEKASDTVKKVDASAWYKGIRIGQTGYTLGDIIWL